MGPGGIPWTGALCTAAMKEMRSLAMAAVMAVANLQNQTRVTSVMRAAVMCHRPLAEAEGESAGWEPEGTVAPERWTHC